MRGRRDRDQLGHRVDAVRAAGGEDRREAVLPHARAEVRGRRATRAAAPVSRIRRMIALATTSRGARSASWCMPVHEPVAGVVDQERALAADRLGDQRLLARATSAPSHSTVGWNCTNSRSRDRGAGAQRQRHAVAGGDRRVGGLREDLAEAAGGQHDRAGTSTAPTPSALALAHHVQGDPGDAAPSAASSRSSARACSMTSIAGSPQRPRRRSARWISAPVASPPACAIRSRWWPPSRVSDELAVGGVVEVGAQRDQLAYRGRALGRPARGRPPRRRARRRRRACPARAASGVSPRAERGGDAALGPPGRARVERVLGDDQ